MAALRARSGADGDGSRRLTPVSGRNLVEEAEDGPQPAVLGRDGYVEPDDHRLGEGEDEAGELRLHGGDQRVDRVPPARLGEGIGVARLVRPQLIDQLAA